MLIKIEVDIGGIRSRFLALANTLKDLDPALKVFGGYMLRRFRAPKAFAARAASTEARQEERSAKATDVIRAVKLKMMRRKLAKSLKSRSAKSPGIAEHNHLAVLKEFDRIVNGGSEAVSLTDAKTSKSLRGRISRAGGKASSKVLGRLTSANRSEVKNHVLTAGSIVPWAQVHNEGGTAGHGAKEPERTWVEITAEDVAVLVNLIEDYATWSFTTGGVARAKSFLRV